MEWISAFSKVHDIVLINFDLLRFSTIKDRRMKAIKAFGHVVNFSNVGFKRKIIKLLDKRSRDLPHNQKRSSICLFYTNKSYDASHATHTYVLPFHFHKP